jgi:hypothetical protein
VADDDTGSGLDPVLSVLIAQLRRNGTLSNTDIDNMQRRLIESDRADLADAITVVLFSDMIDDPGERRASIHVLDGGNSKD